VKIKKEEVPLIWRVWIESFFWSLSAKQQKRLAAKCCRKDEAEDDGRGYGRFYKFWILLIMVRLMLGVLGSE
jgi:hypothetical protein